MLAGSLSVRYQVHNQELTRQSAVSVVKISPVMTVESECAYDEIWTLMEECTVDGLAESIFLHLASFRFRMVICTDSLLYTQ